MHQEEKERKTRRALYGMNSYSKIIAEVAYH